ncbi:hypothetical protein MNBD_ALPHA07-1041 [hydrothermal vent metagenome]|uniref:Uncharacterized protein n=1 Tax=hydrothermal vent metagenome TaxID=652676 RepID=A0A3B0S7Y1_9ZZZZ
MSLRFGFLCVGRCLHARQQRGFVVAFAKRVLVRARLIMFLMARCVFAKLRGAGCFVTHFNALSALRPYPKGVPVAHALNRSIIQDGSA